MELLSLPDQVLEQITNHLECWEVVYMMLTCHKMNKLISEMQPPMTLLDSSMLKPKFKTELGSAAPLIHLFEFEWDGWGDAFLKKMLLKRKRASQSIGKGLAKLFCAWTKTDAAHQWQKERPLQHAVLNFLRQGGNIGFETIVEPSDEPLEEFIECHLNIPNMCWNVNSRRLQTHFTAVMQPLVHALTDFVKDMQPIVPHIAVFISNYDPDIPLPIHRDPPPWTCHSQLETMCTCGDATAECVVRSQWGSEPPSDDDKTSDIDFVSEASSDFGSGQIAPDDESD